MSQMFIFPGIIAVIGRIAVSIGACDR